MESNRKSLSKRRSINMINTNLSHIYHKNLQHVYTDDIAVYEKHCDESIAQWNKFKTERNQLIRAARINVHALVIEADSSVLDKEQKALLDAADKMNTEIVNKAIENVQKRYEDMVQNTELLKQYREYAKDSTENIKNNITSLFE